MAIPAVKNCTWNQPSHPIHLSHRFCRSKSPVARLKPFKSPNTKGLNDNLQWKAKSDLRERNQCEALQGQEMHLSTCVKQILVLHHQVRRGLVGSYRQDLGSQPAGHGTTPLCHALGHQSGLYCISQSAGTECVQGKRSYKLTFVDQEDAMFGSIWGMICFLSLKQISAFNHQWNTKQNTASINTWLQYQPFCGYSPEGRWLRVTLSPKNQPAINWHHSQAAAEARGPDSACLLPLHCILHPLHREMMQEPPAIPLAPEEPISGSWIPPCGCWCQEAQELILVCVHRPQHSSHMKDQEFWAVCGLLKTAGLQQLDLLSTSGHMGW